MDSIQNTTLLFCSKKRDPISAVFLGHEKKKRPSASNLHCAFQLHAISFWRVQFLEKVGMSNSGSTRLIAKSWCLTNLSFLRCCFNLSYLVFLKKKSQNSNLHHIFQWWSSYIFHHEVGRIDILLPYIRYIPEQKKEMRNPSFRRL